MWAVDGWAERFGLPFDTSEHGYGHSSDDVAAVRASAELLLGYHDAVLCPVARVSADRVAEPSSTASSTRDWDPPVTLGVRLVSVVNDDLQHAGQAAFVRGLLPR